MEVACYVRGRMMAGEEMGVQQLTVLRQCLNVMGATPADRSKIRQAEQPPADPVEKFFQ